MNLLLLGIYPWNYSQLSDTVRSMTAAVEDANCIYINPQAEQRSFALNWQERREQLEARADEQQVHADEQHVRGDEQQVHADGTPATLRIWNPPYSFLPTRYGIHRLREKLSASSLPAFASRELGDNWRDNTVMYVTASTLEQSYELVLALQPKRLVFDILDDNLGFPGISPEKLAELKKMFLEIARRSERITAVSQYLVDQTHEWTGKDVEYLPNGVDVDRFRSKPAHEPADMADIPHPRATFMGALTSWIDLRLIEKSARALPGIQHVIVGPVFESADMQSLDNLKQKDNVHILGAKPFQDVPAYMHASDVLLLPRTYDPYSLACDPLKLYEYLATGQPVVSTGHPSAERFADVVYIGKDDESFIEGIRQALDRDAEVGMKQASLVDSLSWKSRADKLLALLQRGNLVAPTQR